MRLRMNYMVVAVTAVLMLESTARAQQDWCDIVPPPKVKKVVYCETLPIGITENKAFVVSLESPFFDGLKRSESQGRVRFEKAGKEISTYPESFVVTVENSPLELSDRSAISQKGRTPRSVVVRWFSSSHVLIREVSAELEEVREIWNELDPPKVWYRASVNSASQPLNAEIEVAVLGENGEELGAVRRYL